MCRDDIRDRNMEFLQSVCRTSFLCVSLTSSACSCSHWSATGMCRNILKTIHVFPRNRLRLTSTPNSPQSKPPRHARRHNQESPTWLRWRCKSQLMISAEGINSSLTVLSHAEGSDFFLKDLWHPNFWLHLPGKGKTQRRQKVSQAWLVENWKWSVF